MNVKAISKNVGSALLVSSFFMAVCVAVSFAEGRDSGFVPLLVSTLITFITGIFPFIFVKGIHSVSLRDGFVTIVLSWLLSFLFGMLPYVMWGGEMSIVDAWFESVSGFTTTGATILCDVEALPRSLLLWRSSTHFIGGLGVVVFLLLVIPSASPFRRKMTSLEVSSLSKEGYRMQTSKLVKVIASVYTGIFLMAAAALIAAGMPPFDAVNHALSLCATGGFSVRNASIAAYGSPLINVIVLLIMVVATTNFALIYTCLVRRSLRPFLKNKMVRFYLGSIVVMTLIVTVSLHLQSADAPSWGKAALDAACTVVSYVTTTGFSFTDNSSWPFLSCMVLLYASIQCATAGSTSSGIKTDRMIVVFRSIGRQIRTMLNPSQVGRIRYADGYMPDEQVLPVLLYIVLYFIILIISTCLLLVCGLEGLEAISGSVACLGNVGPGLGDLSVMCNYDWLNPAAKIICTLDMFLGRIEIYPLLISVSLLFDRRRR